MHGLKTYHVPVHALLPEQFGVCALLEHLALAKHIDDVGLLNCREAMCHCHRGSAFRDSFERSLHEFLTLCPNQLAPCETRKPIEPLTGIEGAGGFIEKQHTRVADKRAGNRDTLLLPAT